MSISSRRAFMLSVVAGGAAVASARVAAQAPVPLQETDPPATALGYKSDTTTVDQARYPNHTPAQLCGGCNFYQGKASDANAPCQLFPGKLVASKGWCSAYSKKPG